MNKDTPHRRKLIFDALDNNKSLNEINSFLENLYEKPVNDLDYLAWRDYFFPIAKSDLSFYKGIVIEGKGLSWVGRKLKDRHKKTAIS